MGLSACGTHTVDHYKNEKPTFVMEEYFNGPIKAWGIVQDRSGKVINRFDIDMVGKWNGNSGTLEEDFVYYDGKTQRRVWNIQKTADGVYEGGASDIIGKAQGQSSGNAVRWVYTMDLPVGDSTYKVRFDDWMYLMNDDVIINRSYVKKFGVTWAEVTIMMQKKK